MANQTVLNLTEAPETFEPEVSTTLMDQVSLGALDGEDFDHAESIDAAAMNPSIPTEVDDPEGTMLDDLYDYEEDSEESLPDIPPPDEVLLPNKFTVEYRHIPIEKIAAVKSVPDFLTECSSVVPLVIEVEDGFLCYDGMELVDKAADRKKDIVLCQVRKSDQADDIEAAILKVASRIKTDGGYASYAENVRAVCKLKDYLVQSNPKFALYSHGGCRRGDEFNGTSKTDAIFVMANRLGLARKTITQMMNFADFVDDATFDALAQQKVKKSDFEAIQSSKGNLVYELRKAKVPKEEIQRQVIQLILKILETLPNRTQETSKPKRSKTAQESSLGQSSLDTQDSDDTIDSEDNGNDNEVVSVANEANTTSTCNDLVPNSTETETGTLSFNQPVTKAMDLSSLDEVKNDLKSVANKIMTVVEQDDPAVIATICKDAISTLTEVSNKADALAGSR